MNIKKQDIIKYLKARNDGYGIEEANKYISIIEVRYIVFFFVFKKIERYSKHTNIL